MGKHSKKLENHPETQAGSKRKAPSLPSPSHSQPLDCDKAQVVYGLVLIAPKQGGKESTGGGDFQSTERNRSEDNLLVPNKLSVRLNKTISIFWNLLVPPD